MPHPILTRIQLMKKYGPVIGENPLPTVRVKKRSAQRAFLCYKCHHKKKRRTSKFTVTTKRRGRNQYSTMMRWYSRTYCEHCYHRWLIVEHEKLRWIA